MKQLPSVAATVLALLLVGAGVGSVTALDTGAADALDEQQFTDSQTTDRAVGDALRPDRFRGPDFETRLAGIGGTDWLDDLDDFLTVFDLSDETHDALVAEAEEMRADGATAADIHHMVHYQLYQHGYDTRDVHAHAIAYHLGEEFDLTDEQVTELASGIVDELDAGADRGDVRAYVGETLDEFGVSDESIRSAVVEQRLRALAERHDLTDEETDELVDGALDLVEDGADSGDLRAYVREKLDAFGVDLSDRGERDRRDGRDRDGRADGRANDRTDDTDDAEDTER